jgi:hypothetical protein
MMDCEYQEQIEGNLIAEIPYIVFEIYIQYYQLDFTKYLCL